MVSRTTLGLLAAVTAVGTVGAYFVLKDRIGPISGIPSITMKVNPKTVRDGIDPINVEIDIKNLEPNTKYQIVFVIELEPSSDFSLFDQPPIAIFSDSNGNFKNTYQFTFNLGNTEKTEKGITAVLSIPDIIDNFRGATPTQFITILPSTEPGPEPTPAEVIKSFSFSPSSGLKPLTVGFSIKVNDPRALVEWTWGDGLGDENQGGTSFFQNHQYFSSGVFFGIVKVTNEDGRTDTRQFSITVDEPEEPGPEPTPAIINNFDQSKSIGQVPLDVSFTFSSSEIIDSGSWDFGDGTIIPLGNNFAISHIYQNPGTFFGCLSVRTVEGFVETKTFTVTVTDSISNPTGQIQPINKQGGTYEFFANFQGKAPLSYSWDFGDGKSGSGQTVSHQYASPGLFTVEVTVRDPDGRIGKDTVTIFVRDSDLEAQPGDVAVTISKAGGDFDYEVLLRNLRSDVTIDGRLLWRLFQGSSQKDSITVNIFLAKSGTFKDIYILKSGLAAGDYLLKVNYINNKTNEFLGNDSIFVTVGGTDPFKAQADQIVKEINQGIWIIPSWYESTIGFYLDGSITAQVFVASFEDLVNRNIITKA